MDISYGSYAGADFSHFASFGANEDWCSKAAAVWATVTGNPTEAETMRQRCTMPIDPFPAAGKPVIWGEPWTEAGRGWRHLPWGWSTSEAFTRNPGSPSIWYTGAASDAVNSMIDAGLKAAAGVAEKGVDATTKLFTGGDSGQSTVPDTRSIGRSLLNTDLVQRTVTRDMLAIGPSSPDMTGGNSYFPGVPSKNTALIIGGVAVLGLAAFLLMKSKGSFAGYSGYAGPRRAKRKARKSARKVRR